MATYYELIIKGNDDVVFAFLEGYFRGKGVQKGFRFGKDLPIHKNHFKEFMEYHGQVVHLIVESSLRAGVESALRAIGEKFELELRDAHRIRRGYFHFKFKTFNRDIAQQIKRAMRTLPAGAKLTDYDPKERIDPEGKGKEGYAPLHEYEFRGKGVIEGEIVAVWKTHMKFEDIEFIESEGICIHHSG